MAFSLSLRRQKTLPHALMLLLTLSCSQVFADLPSALQAMEDPKNPLLLINTSRGEIFVEMFPQEAPDNVANIVALAQGALELQDGNSGNMFAFPYFNGMRFHRVVSGSILQAGSPALHPRRAVPPLQDDEINADFLGLDSELVILPGGAINPLLNISDKAGFDDRILRPLYDRMGIDNEQDLGNRQQQVESSLLSLTVKRAYENMGYQYNSSLPGRSISQGVMALANSGPDTNGSEFFISLTDAEWLNGQHTVVGKVVDGLDVALTIGETEIDPDRYDSLSTLIYSVRLAN